MTLVRQPAQAREQAFDLFTLVRKGEDPTVSRRGVNDRPTVPMLADRHINEHARAFEEHDDPALCHLADDPIRKATDAIDSSSASALASMGLGARKRRKGLAVR